jgi:hypothetical protein
VDIVFDLDENVEDSHEYALDALVRSALMAVTGMVRAEEAADFV